MYCNNKKYLLFFFSFLIMKEQLILLIEAENVSLEMLQLCNLIFN